MKCISIAFPEDFFKDHSLNNPSHHWAEPEQRAHDYVRDDAVSRCAFKKVDQCTRNHHETEHKHDHRHNSQRLDVRHHSDRVFWGRVSLTPGG